MTDNDVPSPGSEIFEPVDTDWKVWSRPPVTRYWTYLICGEPYDGWTKIGFTTGHNPGRRTVDLQCGNPRTLRAVAYWPSNVEQLLHKHFSAVRGNGEWFALPAALLADAASRIKYEQGFIGLITDWPVQRIQTLGPEGASAHDLSLIFDTSQRPALAVAR